MSGDHAMCRRLALLCLAAALCRLSHASAQTITPTLQGVVRDASHAVLPGATVTLRDANTGLVRTTITDGIGAYVLPYVPAGTYDLTMELSGFKTYKRERLRFEIGQEITIDASLDVAGVAETVTVREAAPLVAPTKSAI